MGWWKCSYGLEGSAALLTPCSRVLLDKLTVCKLVTKFPAFYGTRRFITAFTSDRHQSLSWASSIQSIIPHPTSWRSVLILSSHLCLGLPKWSLSLRFPHQYPVYASPLPIRATCPAHLILLDFITQTMWGEDYKSLTLRRLMSYIYGAPILDVSRSHTTTQHSR